ncbi:MAG: inositol monophosphatase [Clostridia bacterium]|nr:inositol monophosphatase [Clostridia bacterium]
MMNMEQLIKIVKETDSIFFDEQLRADVTKKGDADFVTRADYEISEYLHRRLTETFPDIGFISEEGDTAIDETKDYWILDPIDGTTNFMHGLSFCAVSLGLYSGGDVVAGVIYIPYTEELFWAEKGKGAYLNGKPIRCSKNKHLSDCIGILEFNPYFKNDCRAAMDHALKIYSSCQDIRTFGSAAVELAYIACGQADVFLGRYLKPWDYAAGLCMIKEAGGVMTNLDGEVHIGKLNEHMVASNAAVYEEFCALIKS